MADRFKGKYYDMSDMKFRALLKKWCTGKKGWKPLCALSWLFAALGIAAIAGMTISAFDPTVPDWMARFTMILVGLVLAVVPFCLAYVTKNQTMRFLGKPYGNMRFVFLFANETGIQFGYHDAYIHNKYPLNRTVQQVAYPNIHHVEVNDQNQLITVVGRKEQIEYINMEEDRIAYQFTNGHYGDMAEISFFRALENEQEFLDDLKAHGVKIEYT